MNYWRLTPVFAELRKSMILVTCEYDRRTPILGWLVSPEPPHYGPSMASTKNKRTRTRRLRRSASVSGNVPWT